MKPTDLLPFAVQVRDAWTFAALVLVAALIIWQTKKT
jgi:hypothetical protein